MRKKLLMVLFMVVAIAAMGFAQTGMIKGTVTDDDGNPLIGANVLIQGTSFGSSTDGDGYFVIKYAPVGEAVVEATFIGYGSVMKTVEVMAGEELDLEFSLSPTMLSTSTIEVVAERAKPRETPVAFTNVEKIEIVNRLASQDVPMVLNTTPSVYATAQGGGAGDARINVRGFNQRNVAVMINGVPVNDMENGWVYWSNWDGVGDASASIQVQRGLSAVNLATASIGGTMNIVTDPTKQDAGLLYKEEIGSGNFQKTTFFAHTGLIDNKYAISGGIVRKTGDGVIDATWTDAWAYYFAAAYNVNNKNRIELYAVGAPQRHGQNTYRQNIGAYDHDYAKSLDDYNEDALDEFPESPAGRKYNENWNSVSSSYNGKQFWDGTTHKRYSPYLLNERENYYHKPQVNLNWYSEINEKLNFYNVLYYSGGVGGGTGTYGSMGWDYSGPSRVVDWDYTIQRNIDNGEDGSRGILRNSVNTQGAVGILSKAYYKYNDQLTLAAGIDGRYAKIDHYREVRDLLGGDYYIDDASDFWPEEGKRRYLGDKIDYYNQNTVNWFGGYVQGEYKQDALTAYGTLGLTGIKYKHHNYFIEDNGDELEVESDWISGYQLKGGASYKLQKDMAVFGNFGYVTKVPIFDNVIDDGDGTLSDDPDNEKFISLEAGIDYQVIPGVFSFKSNLYYTLWQDRAFTRFIQTAGGDDNIIFLSGVNAVHQGIEAEFAYQPYQIVRLDGAFSIGNWYHTDDVSGTYKDYDQATPNVDYKLYLKDIKIGDAPQQQFMLTGTLFPIKGMRAEFALRHYRYFYADFDPLDRDDPNDRTQSWKAPNYTLFDLHFNYTLPMDMKGAKVTLFGHLLNVFDEIYVQDATDNSSYNAYDGDGVNHRADDAEVFLGLPRTFNMGIRINY